MQKILFLSLIISIYSCGKKDPLIKKWKLVDINLEQAFSDYPKEEKELMLKVYKQAFQGLINKRKMSFEEGNTFKVESPDANGKIIFEQGSWSKIEPNQLITTIEGLSDTLIIIELSNERLVLQDKRDLDKKQLIFLQD